VVFLNGFESHITSAGTFTVVTSSSLNGAFANVPDTGLRLFTTDGLGSFQVNYGADSLFAANSVVLSNFVAVPEPSTYALLGAGALMIVFRLRRRRS
jgi:hypothetical protein